MLSGLSRVIRQVEQAGLAVTRSLHRGRSSMCSLSFVDGNVAHTKATVFSGPTTFEHSRACITGSAVFNKGTAFSENERENLEIRGLMPRKVESLQIQAARVLDQFRKLESPLHKHTFLMSLLGRNQTLFYRVIIDNLEEMTPIIYTPTVGEACQKFSEAFRAEAGMFISPHDAGEMDILLDNWRETDVDIVVVSDGSRILGLGDLGCNGMGIPIGKLALYVAAAGFHPSRCLPVMLDFGTDTQALLDDPFYLGVHQNRVDDDEFYELFDEFMEKIYCKWPNVLVQFEDFSTEHAFGVLERYRDKYLCFNDDIQGTGAVVAAGLYSATKGLERKLSDNKFVFLGAGSSGTGVANVIANLMVKECGITKEEAIKRFYFVDSQGLLTSKRENIADHKLPFARDDIDEEGLNSLLEVIRYVKPTGLVGISGIGKMFTEEVIREMAAINERPIVFALSNPTEKSECTMEECIEWSDGRAIFASGSPFDAVERDGQIIPNQQCNNMYIFPGLGLGASLVGARVVSDEMILAAIRGLADCVTESQRKKGFLFPSLQNIRNHSSRVAASVAEAACKEGLTNKKHPKQRLRSYVRGMQYDPVYVPLM